MVLPPSGTSEGGQRSVASRHKFCYVLRGRVRVCASFKAAGIEDREDREDSENSKRWSFRTDGERGNGGKGDYGRGGGSCGGDTMTVAVASQGQLVTASSKARLTWTIACANEEGGTGDGNSDGNGEAGGGGELSCVLLCGAPEGAHKGAPVNCGGTNQTSDGNGAGGGDGGEGALVGGVPIMDIPGDSMPSAALRMAALESLGTAWALLREGGVIDRGAAHETPGNATNTGNTGNTVNTWWNKLNTGRRNHSTSVQMCLRRIKERLVAAFTEDEVRAFCHDQLDLVTNWLACATSTFSRKYIYLLTRAQVHFPLPPF